MARRQKVVVVEEVTCDLHAERGDEEQLAEVHGRSITVGGVQRDGDLCRQCDEVVTAVEAFLGKATGADRIPTPSAAEQAVKAAAVAEPVPAAAPPIVKSPAPEPVPSQVGRRVGAPETVICPHCRVSYEFKRPLLKAHSAEHGMAWPTVRWLMLDEVGTLQEVPAEALRLVGAVETAPEPPQSVLAASEREQRTTWKNDPDAMVCGEPGCGQPMRPGSRNQHSRRAHQKAMDQIQWKLAHSPKDRRQWLCHEPKCNAQVAGLLRKQHAAGHGRSVEQIRWTSLDPVGAAHEEGADSSVELVQENGKLVPLELLDPVKRSKHDLVLCIHPDCKGRAPLKASNRAGHAKYSHNTTLSNLTFVYASDPTQHYLGNDEALDYMLADKGLAVDEATAERIRRTDRQAVAKARVRCPYTKCGHKEVLYTRRGAHLWDEHKIPSQTSVKWELTTGWPQDPPTCGTCREPFPTITSLLNHERWYITHPNEAHKPYGVGEVTVSNMYDREGGIVPKDRREKKVLPGTTSKPPIEYDPDAEVPAF